MKMKTIVKISKLLLFVFTLIAAAVFSVNDSGASTIEFNMDTEYSGGTEPSSDGPWAQAKFSDNGFNSVTLTMSAFNLTDAEFISVWLFNFDPVLDPDLLVFELSGTPGSMPYSINTGINAFKAGPSRFYDIEFDFSPQPGGFEGRFTSGETVVYNITYTGTETINAFSFNFESMPGKNERHATFQSAAHIQGIGYKDGSGWVGNTTVVPEPVSSTLFIAGAAALGLRKFRIRRNQE